ncbi:hypothetical protein CAPTEDRAFT_229283 [Capitella teleta]|uniref:Fibronectin type-III domain-containing protein n=1 Tax=Capitella teleta TaxID=283909 RepID=R7T985_CAPTE|nr:hypothetical protein CAPTEDRAFT_229283 [Capitella teleta]|eukprot:ELT89998.1 hypothetical protein CAPTEDRAFT_229283 [Capitella teleta]
MAFSSNARREDLALPQAPHNLSLAHILATAAIVKWETERTDPNIGQFEMTLLTIPSTTANNLDNEGSSIIEAYRTTQKAQVPSVRGTVTRLSLSGGLRTYTLQDLYPDTEYQLYMVAVNADGMSNASSVASFRTPATTVEALDMVQVKPGEVIIVSLIVSAWICAIILFLHKWGKIRIIQPSEPRFEHAPKNLDTIKVVKTPTESVIYRSYSKNFSQAVQTREKRRIERMNTMPNIKVPSHPTKNSTKKSSGKVMKKRQTVPNIQVVQKESTGLGRLKEIEEGNGDCAEVVVQGDYGSLETSFITASKA